MKLKNKQTGKITEIEEINLVVMNDERDCYESFAEYHSLAELNADWEDYVIAEPLIKDEKVRKAISTWYEALPLDDLSEKRIMFTNGEFCVGIYHIDCGNYVALKGIKERFYTIKELCGEEE